MNSNIKNFVRKTGGSYFWGIRILPKAQREALYTIYAFHHHIDDFAYNPNISKEEKKELIGAWREEFNNIFDKKVPSTEIGRKIYKNCMRFKLPKSEFIRLLDSISLDVERPLKAPKLDIFNEYCRGVAGVLCNFSLRILGCNDEPLIEELSNTISSSVMITNILKDIKDASKHDRLYIPQEFLKKAGIFETNPEKVIINKNLNIARQELAEIAEKNYRKTYNLIEKLDKCSAKTVRSMTNINKKYFEIMQKRGWEVISPKPKISRIYMFSLAVKGLLGRTA
ncbi:MAG: squalene/phytoene synthase family protein [Alphaproteobacteria bacterium]